MRLAVVNLKGGVAKSTTAVYLACGLAGHGRTLLIDADPQGSALTWSEIADGLPAPVVALPIKDLHRRIDDVALGRDFVVIDTPPHNTAIVAGALRAADVAVTPIQPSMLDLNRLTSTIELVEEIRAGHPLDMAALLVRTRPLTRSRAAVRKVLGKAGVRVLAAEVPQREAIAATFGTRLDPKDLGPYAPVLTELLEGRTDG